MERRFRFKSPSSLELFMYSWGKLVLCLVLAFCIVLNPFAKLDFTAKVLVALLTFSIAGVVFWRVGDIGRRDEQVKHGFVELTASELRVSLSAHSLLRIDWANFIGVEARKGWLSFQFQEAETTQGDSSRRLDRVRLDELEDSDALVEALQTRTFYAKR